MNKVKYLDTFAHIVLYLILGTGAFVFFLLRFNPQAQFVVVAVLSVLYLVWGVIYHLMRGDFSKKLALEYLIIALIATTVAVVIFLV